MSVRVTTDPHRQVNKVCRSCPKDAKLWLIVERDESGVTIALCMSCAAEAGISPELELVPVFKLQPGDRIMLDDGSRQTVRATELGRHKDAMKIRLKARPPIEVDGYFYPVVRRVREKK